MCDALLGVSGYFGCDDDGVVAREMFKDILECLMCDGKVSNVDASLLAIVSCEVFFLLTE